MRHFTLDEAHALLPVVVETCERIRGLAREEKLARERVRILARRHLEGGADPGAEREVLRGVAERLATEVEDLLEMGVHLKGLNPFLVDFPALLDGRTVLLCWREGEAAITHFHSTETGFSGRQPIEEPAVFGQTMLQ
ncbi:MAG: DUF2203 domain-containing protein [Deltaproteobacteria bacterium]|nr:DUF2203 domain-containing protein [Deltaproteobacteria bacterium]